jgi:hypothetical protein
VGYHFGQRPQIPDPLGPQLSDRVILVHSIKFAIFSPVFVSIIVKVAKLTAIVAKNGSVIKQT